MTESNVFNVQLPSEALLSARSEISDSGTKSKREPGTSYEVFRNNTTAVEVIVKEIPRKPRKKLSVDDMNLNVQNVRIRSLEETNDMLLNELNKANAKLISNTNAFEVVFVDMKKQLDTSCSHEVEAREKSLKLQFENEKLKVLLNSKTNLMVRLKKELNNLKKIIKFVVKNLSLVPDVSQVTFMSDAEYDIFETELKNDVKFLGSFYDGAVTCNSTNVSQDMKGADKNV